KHLLNVVSDTYLLMIKTHGYHWNVTGSLFPQLHALFNEQYTALFEAVDTIAERIRALGIYAPGSTQAFHMHTAVKEAGDKPPAAKAMLQDLLKSHEQVRVRIEEARAFANEIEDSASEDLMIERLRAHDKVIWMLRAQV
ncbi:MAG TPA: DNA starvation/stationary phase protection protein, partial [Alphaproteobacteria bacterium]|nr:DNA starvation/stationary phase protection protein [Alphaproteobacteria bacterium]